jgi:hypothetical protein
MIMKKLLNMLASMIARGEGGKSQVKIGDIRQILALLKRILAENPDLIKYLLP